MYRFFPDLAPKRAQARSEAERTNPQFKDNHGGRNLAVLRCALIALKARHAAHLSWPALFELSCAQPTIPYNMVCNNAFK